MSFSHTRQTARSSLLAGAAGLLMASGAAAQTPEPKAPPAKPPAGRPATVEGVVVQGQSSGMRVDIDRKSYGVANDLQATSGSISDALRNVPSVQVDVQGNVSLRGDSNVTIMIDGKPSTMFQGEGRAAALQALPADQIERVEVITNPSAAFNPEGSAGVINLVTKQTRKLGASGSVRANVGSDERWNVGVSGSRSDGKLTLSGDLTYRHDTQKVKIDDVRQRLDPASGQFLESRQSSRISNRIDLILARGGLDYDLDPRSRISLSAMIHSIRPSSLGYDHLEYDAAGGGLARLVDRVIPIDQSRDNADLSATWRRKFDGQDHELVVNASQEFGRVERNREALTLFILPASPDTIELGEYDNRTRQTEVKIDYTRPLPADGKLKAGYALQYDDNVYENLGRRGPAGQPNPPVAPALTYEFQYEQAINAAYVTYQQPFGDVTVLGGLRFEDTHLDLDLVVGGPLRARHDYSRVYPSLHLSYALAEGQQLTASYSMRIQRPTADDLNPFLIELDPFNYRRGNPFLEPQETDSFELGYQYRKAGRTLLATLYYRESSKGISDLVRDAGGGVFVTTRENLNESRSGGLELVANGRLTPKLTYNLSGNVYWNEIDASQLGFAEKRDGYTLSGRGNLNWQVTPKDFVQINGFMNGKRLTAQGHVSGFSMLNLGYRRKVNDQLSFTVTGQDVLDTFKETQTLDTPTLQGKTRRRFSQRGVFVGFTYTFGRQRRPDPGFDFGGGPPPT
ncbi:TonB-dependent receptor [Phenylobacterium sp. J426]|uniref:TonB-dependent receptor domain-containing protein n=1 Tax=Phenylobacterium sp. J426 TaxID=2898439 RepID=UPI002150BC47|nr:TonB-dependent receptor [Phenylobacterium sp. J426]MCR5874197.1 TonB-dependent receptor [Phenylobacterium sp. J426]